MVKPETISRYDYVMKHKGLFLAFLMFLIPGFPKDYLCYHAGLGTYEASRFFIVSTGGRLLGTVLLTLEGSFLRDKRYAAFFTVLGISILFILLVMIYRSSIERWFGVFKSRSCIKNRAERAKRKKRATRLDSFAVVIAPVAVHSPYPVLIAVGYDGAYFVGLIHDMQQVDVLGTDVSHHQNSLLHPIDHPAPVVAAHEHHRESPDLLGLNEREGFEQFIHGTEASRKDHVRYGIFYEHELAHEEIPELHLDVLEGIGRLLHGELDVQPHGYAVCVLGPFVCRLHDARSAARDNRESVPGKHSPKLSNIYYSKAIRGEPGASKNSNGRPDIIHRFESFNQFGHDAEYPPRIGFCQIFHPRFLLRGVARNAFQSFDKQS